MATSLDRKNCEFLIKSPRTTWQHQRGYVAERHDYVAGHTGGTSSVRRPSSETGDVSDSESDCSAQSEVRGSAAHSSDGEEDAATPRCVTGRTGGQQQQQHLVGFSSGSGDVAGYTTGSQDQRRAAPAPEEQQSVGPDPIDVFERLLRTSRVFEGVRQHLHDGWGRFSVFLFRFLVVREFFGLLKDTLSQVFDDRSLQGLLRQIDEGGVFHETGSSPSIMQFLAPQSAGPRQYSQLSQVLGPTLLKKAAPELGEASPIFTINTDAEFAEATHVLLYFSAEWCPPCHKFTPLLVRLETHARLAGKGLKVGDECGWRRGTRGWRGRDGGR